MCYVILNLNFSLNCGKDMINNIHIDAIFLSGVPKNIYINKNSKFKYEFKSVSNYLLLFMFPPRVLRTSPCGLIELQILKCHLFLQRLLADQVRVFFFLSKIVLSPSYRLSLNGPNFPFLGFNS